MRLRHKKGAEDEILQSPYCIHIENNNLSAINDSKYFYDTKPLYIELGMGKGRFVCEMAKNNPNINFIGIEKSATIVLKAIENFNKIIFDNIELKNIDKLTIQNHINNTNLRFLCESIENLKEYFSPHSIDKIFLNFSDPWPKKRHENRRLTHISFLSIYEDLLKKDGLIEFKTDNKSLFDFSLEEIKKSHFELITYTYDLHNDPALNENNIMTEYEEKFSKKNNPICKLIIKNKKV